jgi:hypothetical protein
MSHRGQAHARRRVALSSASLLGTAWNGESAMVPRDWDATSYDDVIPHRLRATLVLDDDGDPAGLSDLVRDDVAAEAA